MSGLDAEEGQPRLPATSGGPRRTLLKNTLSLFAVQGVASFVPLLLTPYLARIFGVGGFGQFAIATTATAYLVGLTDWGFGLGATQEVARIRHDRSALSEFIARTLAARLVMGAVALSLLAVLTLAIPDRSLTPLLAAGAVAIIGASLSVDWLLHGLERMGVTALTGSVGWILTVPATLLLVHDRSDLWISVAIQGSVSVVSAILNWITAVRIIKLPVLRPNFRGVLGQLTDYRHFYFANLSITVYTAGAPIILGLVAGQNAAGLFAGADRISRAVLRIINQFGSVVYPRVNAMLATSSGTAPAFFRRLLLFQSLTTLIISVALFATAPLLVRLLLGPSFVEAVVVLRCLAALPFIIGVSNVLAIQMMLPLGLKRSFVLITSGSAALYLLLLFPLGKEFGASGAAVALVLVEVLVCILCLNALRRGAPDMLGAVLGRAAGASPADPLSGGSAEAKPEPQPSRSLGDDL